MNEGVLFFKQRNFRLFFFTLSEVEVTVACTSLLFSCFVFLLFFFFFFFLANANLVMMMMIMMMMNR